MSGNSFRLVILLLIIALGASFFIFPGKWSSIIDSVIKNNDSEQTINLLNENKLLKEENEKSNERVLKLEMEFKNDSLKLDSLESISIEIDKFLSMKDKDLEKSQIKLREHLKKQKEQKDILEKIKNTPSNKRGEELLHSVKQRLK